MKAYYKSFFIEQQDNGGFAGCIERAIAAKEAEERGEDSRHGYLIQTFVTEDNKDPEIYLTEYYHVRDRYFDIGRIIGDWLADGQKPVCKEENPDLKFTDAYRGVWTEDIEKDVNLYYLVSGSDGMLYKFFICKTPSSTSPLGVEYFSCVQNYIMSVTPEIGDMLFDEEGITQFIEEMRTGTVVPIDQDELFIDYDPQQWINKEEKELEQLAQQATQTQQNTLIQQCHRIRKT